MIHSNPDEFEITATIAPCHSGAHDVQRQLHHSESTNMQTAPSRDLIWFENVLREILQDDLAGSKP